MSPRERREGVGRTEGLGQDEPEEGAGQVQDELENKRAIYINPQSHMQKHERGSDWIEE